MCNALTSRLVLSILSTCPNHFPGIRGLDVVVTGVVNAVATSNTFVILGIAYRIVKVFQVQILYMVRLKDSLFESRKAANLKFPWPVNSWKIVLKYM